MTAQHLGREARLRALRNGVRGQCDADRSEQGEYALAFFEATQRPVCTDNLNAGVAVMKSAQDGA
jgi:hypothetical protein